MKRVLEWWESLSFLSPMARATFGRLVKQLDRGLTTTPAPALLDSPGGWAGTSSRGPWSRLVPEQWALAQAHPAEFARRADEGELTFWDLAFEPSDTAHSLWVWLDVGPDQVGACRVVQIAVLLWLQQKCLASGGNLYWGVAQEPEFGYEGLGADELKKFLALRTVDVPSLPGECVEGVQTWCVGSPRWVDSRPRGAAGIALEQCSKSVVSLTSQGRKLRLKLPSDDRALALLRRPLAWKMGSEIREQIVPEGPFCFNPSGQKIIVVTDSQIILVPIPNTINEPPGNPRAYDLQYSGKVIAVSMERRGINLVQESGEDWIFSRLNPGVSSENYRYVVPAKAHQESLGTCWRVRDAWNLWIGQTHYVQLGKLLDKGTQTRRGLRLGGASILVTSAGLMSVRTQTLIHRFDKKVIPHRVLMAKSHWCGVERLGYTLAYDMGSGRWRFFYLKNRVDIELEGEVVGLHCGYTHEHKPQLVVHQSGCLKLVGPGQTELLDTKRTTGECVVHPNGLLAFRSEDREVCCYDLHSRTAFHLVQPS